MKLFSITEVDLKIEIGIFCRDKAKAEATIKNIEVL